MAINLLPPEIYNKISAGEVVERPASIIKELIENSIDAGADKITVQVYNGGIDKIIISDNGCGILHEDLEPAFLPHATSKISKEDDLYSIATLGFRGEALASIAAVSKVEVTTKTANGNVGAGIRVEGGTIVAKGEKGSPQGTTIIVENLFFNTPARAKFLKAPKKEESEITTLISRLILANPNISIKYFANDKQIYNSTGKGIEDAIFAIYGAELIKHIIPVKNESDKFKINGYISKSNFAKANRTYQTVIINGRWVSDGTVAAAISQSYEPYMMKHSFPFCVLYLELPIDQVDVNVHPNKLEVRFADGRAVFSFVYHSLKDAIFNDLTKLMDSELTKQEDSKPQLMTPEQVNSGKIADTGNPINDYGMNIFFNNANMESDNSNVEFHQDGDSVLNEIIIEKLTGKSIKELEKDVMTYTKPEPIQTQLISKEIEDKNEFLSSKVIGKLFNTFVIMEMDDSVYFIDQHAAHERLLFDKLVQKVRSKQISSQPLLIPFIINVNNTEEQFIMDNMSILTELGFEISQFGNLSFKISSIPSLLPNLNVTAFFNNFLAEMNYIISLKSVDLILDNLAQTACKHAVKGGDDLNKQELIHLISDIGGGDVTLQCPHGRPFVIKFTRKDIDKWFKRIV